MISPCIEGSKDDNDKLDLSLIPPEVFTLLGEVYQYGAKKYGRDNWTKGFDENRLLAAALRHYVAYIEDECNDQESNLPHLASAAWNLLTVVILNMRKDF